MTSLVVVIGCVSGAGLLSLAGAAGARFVSNSLGLPLVSMPALGAAILSHPIRRMGCDLVTTAVFIGVGTFTITLPVLWASFVVDGVFVTHFGLIDLAGATPAICAPAYSALIVGLFARFSRSGGRTSASMIGALRQRRRGVLVGAIGVTVLVWVAWAGWILGMELAIDDVSMRIASNSIVTPVVSVSAWLLVRGLRRAPITPGTAFAGVVCGLAAVTSAGGYIDTIGAVIIGLVSGAAGSFLTDTFKSWVGGAPWLTPGALAVGSTVGLVGVGLFSTRVGAAYTGQPEVLLGQISIVVMTVIFALIVTTIIWLPLRRRAAPGGQSSHTSTELQ